MIISRELEAILGNFLNFGVHGTDFFSNIVIIRWNQLDQRAVGARASSINAFKGCLNKISETRMGFFMD